jgi:6-phosphogluconolactonase
MKTLLALAALASLVACGDDSPTGGSGGGGVGGSGAGTTSNMGGSPQGGDGGAGGVGGDGTGGVPVVAPTLPIVYVGNGDGEIQIFDLDRDTGSLSSSGSVDAGANPSFLAASPDKTHLYAVDEGNSEVLAFEINQNNGNLTEIGTRQSSAGNGPAYVSVDATGAWVFVANYGGGTVAVLPVAGDGSLGAAVDVETPGQNPHLIRSDAANTHVYVPCLGSDIVAQFDFDVATGQLEPMGSDATLPAGTGPRHLEFHPSLPVVYVIGEQGDSLTTFDVAASGELSNPVTVSTLPNGADPDANSCADLHIHPNGLYLYGSNRGHDSIAHFEVDEDTGAVDTDGHTPTDGEWPRNFGIDPAGSIMLVANQHSDEVVVFFLDPNTGALGEISTTTTGASPSWVGVVALPIR